MVSSLLSVEVIEAEASLRTSFDEVCKEANVFWGFGPAMAYFETPEPVKRYVYISFGMSGEKPHGAPSVVHSDMNFVLQESIKSFRGWLQSNRTLVWRVRPEMDLSAEGKWASYWRCVQLDDDAKQLTIVWSF